MRRPFIKRSGQDKASIALTILEREIDEDIFRKDIDLVIVDIFIHEMMKISRSMDIFPENTK